MKKVIFLCSLIICMASLSFADGDHKGAWQQKMIDKKCGSISDDAAKAKCAADVKQQMAETHKVVKEDCSQYKGDKDKFKECAMKVHQNMKNNSTGTPTTSTTTTTTPSNQ